MRTLVPEVTEGPRSEILRCVEKHPGVHLRSIERRTELPLGQVLYHLDRLERMGLVGSVRDAGFRRYFASDDISRHEKPILSALRHAAPRRILVALLETPGLTHKELVSRVELAGSTLTFHLQRLCASDVLARARDGAAQRYHVARPALTTRMLVYHRASLQDEVVDRFVRDLLQRAIPSS